MSGSGSEAFPNVREWPEGPSGCPGVVSRHSWMSGDPTGCPGVVGSPSWMSRSGR